MTFGTSGMYFEALDDLNVAAELTPEDPEVYAMRAAAYRQLETPDLAEENIDQALKLSPSHPGALLERGYLRREKGDIEGARTDWLTVIQTMPGTDIADFARHARTMAKAGVYSLAIHHDQILVPIILQRWGLEQLNGLDDDAERARDRVLRYMTRLGKVSRRVEARMREGAEKEPVSL